MIPPFSFRRLYHRVMAAYWNRRASAAHRRAQRALWASRLARDIETDHRAAVWGD